MLPLTHFLRIVRGIMLKGAGWGSLWPEAAAIAAFIAVAGTVAMLRYRQTLDSKTGETAQHPGAGVLCCAGCGLRSGGDWRTIHL